MSWSSFRHRGPGQKKKMKPSGGVPGLSNVHLDGEVWEEEEGWEKENQGNRLFL